jgi:hypothetical protein
MLAGLFRRPGLTASFAKTTFKNYVRPRVSLTNFQAGRSLWTSPRVGQQYRYKRFNDPYANTQRGTSGYFQSLWYRFTPGQKVLLVGVGGGAPIFYVTHLETVEQTGRRRFIFMSKSMEEQIGKAVCF